MTDEPDLLDEMYDRADMHNESGRWQMVFGVNTIPEYRGHGYAGELIQRAIDDAKAQGRAGIVLTCKDKLVDYYSKFGFVNEGMSDKSRHGGVELYQMRYRNRRLTFRLFRRSRGSNRPQAKWIPCLCYQSCLCM